MCLVFVLLPEVMKIQFGQRHFRPHQDQEFLTFADPGGLPKDGPMIGIRPRIGMPLLS